MDINRDALILYLRDLRDLEMARYHIKNMIAREEAAYQKTDAQLQKDLQKALQSPNFDFWEFQPEREQNYSWKGSTGVCILGIIVGTILFVVSIPGIQSGSSSSNFFLFEFIGGLVLLFFSLLMTVGVIMVVSCVVVIIKDISGERKYREELEKTNAEIRARNRENEERARQHNAEERERKEQYTQHCAESKKKYARLRVKNQQKWGKRKQFLEGERDRVKGLLDDAYGENILPAPYRQLAPLYYIYDYMSTSRVSFEDTLMHEHMESGFQRILARLDKIVENEAEEIFHLRRMEAQNEKMIAQNEDMLVALEMINNSIQDSSLRMNATLGGIRDNTYQTSRYAQQTSQYAQQASQYAGIAATYSAANVYFSWANYLKN
ncbi:MAG: hypothetical protein LUD84_10810 [Clostridiales bacterium]|nr:hypothetical protein [Clostridiales bacterium]